MTEYAPEYTRKERLFLLLKYFFIFTPLFAVTQFWFMPWFKGYVERSHCMDYGSFTGSHVVFYFIFVFIPFSSALLIFLTEGLRSLRVIRLGQNPLPGEKVFKKTKYTYGVRAKIKPYIVLFLVVFFVIFSIKGVFWANEIIYRTDVNLPVCDGPQ